jgi:hypothetical protein
MHRGGGWVDPPEGQKHQRGKRPGQHDGEAKPSKKGSERDLAGGGPGGGVRAFSHTFRIVGGAGLPQKQRAFPLHPFSTEGGCR